MTVSRNLRRATNQVTPLILTYNEEPNIKRALDGLRWAERVVVLDSGSTDATESIVRSFANTVWHVRKFDNHQRQWEHGVHHTGITTDYVLALDADMIVSPDFVMELETKFLANEFAGGIVPFKYSVYGQTLAGSLLAPQLRLLKRDCLGISQKGHTQDFSVRGASYSFNASIIHDDRKPLEHWTNSQLGYSRLESQRLQKLNANASPRLRDRLRRWGLMPIIAGLSAYIRAGGFLRGAAAAHYAYERATYESLLALRIFASRLEEEADAESYLGDDKTRGLNHKSETRAK